MTIETTPMMQQYQSIKDRYPGFLLFYRMGDFYELFGADAQLAAGVLNITLTQRRTSKEKEGIPMCGVPFHAAENYIAKLLEAGHKVALCEQTEDPAEARQKRGSKALVNRDVVRLYTGGTLTEDSMLPERQNNYLVALHQLAGELALGWLELSTGEFAVTGLSESDIPAELARLNPGEIVLEEELATTLAPQLAGWEHTFTHPYTDLFDSREAGRQLLSTFQVATLDGFGLTSRAQQSVCGALLGYVALTQVGRTVTLNPPQVLHRGQYMYLDQASRTNLELTHTLRGQRKGSLLDAVDMTVTAAGARLLSQWLTAPLTSLSSITARHDAVDVLLADNAGREQLRSQLKSTTDMSRALTRLSLDRGGPRDLGALRQGLALLPDIRATLAGLKNTAASSLLAVLADALDGFTELADLLSRALQEEDLPMLARDGGFIAPGYCAELDGYRNINSNGMQLLQALERREAERTGISSLRVKYNKVWGYYLEATKSNADKVPDDYIHRQTTTNSQRFTTPELIEVEKQLASAGANCQAREEALFAELVAQVNAAGQALLRAASALASLDVLAAGAELAARHQYIRPQMTESRAFHIAGGRHPVVERTVKTFMPNDCQLGDGRLWLITGPNMAGKSTFLRQNALLAILAHAGLFVPAEQAEIGLIDRIFTRIGAADDLARGQSTFMVEMVETAGILNNATDRSLVILDEIGRGTATFDGLSIAWACVEYLAQHTHCRALFATHYHELTQLSDKLPHVSNHHVAVKEWAHEIVFMHEVTAGASPRSYGIHVGRLAGLPTAVTARAEEVLHQLEDDGGKANIAEQISLFQVAAVPAAAPARPAAHLQQLRDMVADLNPDSLTPREAHTLLYALKDVLDVDTAAPAKSTGTV